MQLFLPVLMTGRARETSSEDLLLNSYIERKFFSAQLCTAAESQSLLDSFRYSYDNDYSNWYYSGKKNYSLVIVSHNLRCTPSDLGCARREIKSRDGK